MWNGLKRLWPALPQPCLLCAAPGHRPLCPDCEFDLPYLTRHPHRCRLCALPLPGADAGEGRYCGPCLREPPPFEHSRIVCRYDYPLDQLIHRFKYRHRLTHGRVLSQLLVAHLVAARAETDEEDWPELLVPVPMHWQRRLIRGFNQTDLLAADLGRALGLPVRPRLLKRRQFARPQSGLTRHARALNLRHTFETAPGQRQHLIGRRLALVDDVVTTASTVRAASRLLLEAGAASVEVWALARTPDPRPE